MRESNTFAHFRIRHFIKPSLLHDMIQLFLICNSSECQVFLATIAIEAQYKSEQKQHQITLSTIFPFALADSL
jgi:hypothetical protein